MNYNIKSIIKNSGLMGPKPREQLFCGYTTHAIHAPMSKLLHFYNSEKSPMNFATEAYRTSGPMKSPSNFATQAYPGF